MSLLYYFDLPIIFIFSCMVLLRLSGVNRKRFQWMTRNSGEWLASWSIIGFVAAFALGVVAWIMNNDFVISHAEWVWPFCIGLMALEGKPTTLEILMVLTITALENAILYLLLAGIVGFVFHLIGRMRNRQKESLSILGR